MKLIVKNQTLKTFYFVKVERFQFLDDIKSIKLKNHDLDYSNEGESLYANKTIYSY